jgi:PPOX class probable FMN-dependent enzyme
MHEMKIQSVEQLRSLYSHPTERALRKQLAQVDRHMNKFITLSPFLVISSSSTAFLLDASSRGGEPGFVKVVDDTTLLIPDAPGNNRLDTLQNIISTSQVGLLFFIPGVDEMLRVNGQASLSTAPDLLARFANTARPPKLVIEVCVREAYLHCAKSLMRSKLWDMKSQVERSVLPSMGEMLKEQIGLEGPAESQEEMLKRFASTL